MFRIALVVMVIGTANCNPLDVPKCRLEDSDCLTSSFQKAIPIFMAGIPEYDVQVLDPLEVGKMKVDIAGLNLELNNGKLKGMKSSVIDKVKFDSAKHSLEVTYHGDVDVKGDYRASGRILLLPIEGDGKIKMKIKNLKIKMTIPFAMEEGAGGKHYLTPKSYHYDFEVRDNMNIDLTNLFNGNKELSVPTLKFINENWKDISREFGKPMLDSVAKIFYKNVLNYLSKSPIEDIALV